LGENLRLDRVCIGSKNLGATAQWLESVAGLRAEESWWFPSGLANRIAYSGSTAIELMGVGFPGAEMVSPFVGQVSARTTAGDRWLTWVIATDDIDVTAARLGLEVTDAFAMPLAGQRVAWRMTGAVEAFFSEPYLPFFVSYAEGEDEWRERALRPDPAFDVARIEVSGDEARLRDWLGDAEIAVEVTPGPPEVRSVSITTANGELALSPGNR
jgi:hypothetical protein